MIARILAPFRAGGDQALPVPEPVSLPHLAARGAVLAAPAWCTAAARETRCYPVTAEFLYAALLRVGAERSDTRLTAAYPTRLQAHYVARGRWPWAPVTIVVEACAMPGGAVPLLYACASHAMAGFGAPRRRVKDWLAALDAVLKE